MKVISRKQDSPVNIIDTKHATFDKETDFNWCVSTILHKKNRVFCSVKEYLQKNSLKFGVVVPTSVKEALELDRANPITFGRIQSIRKLQVLK